MNKVPVKLINAIRIAASIAMFCFFVASLYGVYKGNCAHIVTAAGFLTFGYITLKNK